MNTSRFPIALCLVGLASLISAQVGNAALFVTKVSQGGGANWSAAVWSNPPNTAVSAPTAGNTYECVFNNVVWGNNTANTRIRNALADGVLTFPGDSLTLHTNTDIRLKRNNTGANNVNSAVSATILNFPGVGGNPGLIWNGGILNPGDDNGFVVTGRIHVAGSGIIANGDNGGGSEQRAFRAIHLRGILTGTGPITLVQGHPTNANMMSCDGSGFSGNWIVQAGYLRGDGNNSLGMGNIFVTPTNANTATTNSNFAVLELNYDISSPGTLVLSNHPVSGARARMILHQNCTFSSVIINGTPLTAGAHPFAELIANFPNNFAPGGSGSLIVQPPAPPNAPTNVTAVSEDSKVTLSWSAQGNTDSFFVNRGDVSGGPYVTIGITAGNGNTFTDTTVVNGLSYYYVIVATNSLGSSPHSAEVIGQPNPVVTNIVAVGGTNQVTVSWDAMAGATSYSVSRSTTSNGTYTVVGSGIAGTSHVDTTVQSGRTYWYRVTAALLVGQSGQSAAVPATTAPGAPVAAVTLFASTVQRVSWTSDPVVTGFSVEQSTNGVDFSPLAFLGAAARSFTNSGLDLNTTYFYRVQAVNATGPSDYSAVVSNTTPVIGYNVNFQLGTSPTPPGYIKDIGELYGDRTNGFFYGWTNIGGTNITVDARQRNNASSPDLRYDTFIHLMKANTVNPALSATWEMEIPNGFYSVHIVAGDPDNGDPNTDRFQFNVEGALTSLHTATTTPFLNRFGDLNISVGVSDGRLTIGSGPLALNNKIAFVDIYPAVPVAPAITLQPTNIVIEQSRPLSVVAAANGSAVLQYQWYFDNGGGPIAVANGTNSTLFFARPQPTDSGDYYLIVTNYGGSATSDVATITVEPDTTVPSLVSVGTLDGLTVGVCFSEDVDTNSPAALEPSNYQVDAGNNTVTAVSYLPDSRTVKLTVTTPIVGTVTLDVLDIPDYAGNSSVLSTNLTSLGFTAGDVGGPTFAGRNFTCDNETFEIVGGGADIWGNGDQGYLATKTISGDFDARIRVTSLRGSNAITKAVLVARETRESGSAAYHISVNPTPPGRNQVEMGFRPAFSNATAAVGASFVPAGVPDAWMRLVRVGNTFIGYRSSNGVDWVQLGQSTAALSNDLQVGFGVTAHDNTLLATGTFSGLSISQSFPDLSVIKFAHQESVNLGQNVTYTVAVTNSGAVAATGCVLTDILPAGLTFVSVTAGQGSCTNSGNTVTCDLGEILRGYAAVTIVATATNVGSITNRATVTTTSLENSLNNTGSAIITVVSPTPSPIVASMYAGTNGFTAAIQTQNGLTYALQYKDNLNPGTLWQTLSTFSGDGTVKTFNDPGTNSVMRFYQIVIP